MGYVDRTQGLTIAESTYNKLKSLKQDGETFDDVVRKLVDMDQKYNIHDETIEFEFLTETNSKVFRVIFENNAHKVEYWNKTSFSNSIRAWNNYPSISDEDKELFISFIVKETSFNLLKSIDGAADFGNFIIRRVG